VKLDGSPRKSDYYHAEKKEFIFRKIGAPEKYIAEAPQNRRN
jgi:hypothetical protein